MEANPAVLTGVENDLASPQQRNRLRDEVGGSPGGMRNDGMKPSHVPTACHRSILPGGISCADLQPEW